MNRWYISRKPSYNLNSLLSILGDQWLIFLLLSDHFFKLGQAFLKLLLGWRIFSNIANQLHSIEPGLIVMII